MAQTYRRRLATQVTILALGLHLLLIACGQQVPDTSGVSDEVIATSVVKALTSAAQANPTFTQVPLPTYTSQPTFTPAPTYTPPPTYTPLPTYTQPPTMMPTPTATLTPTSTRAAVAPPKPANTAAPTPDLTRTYPTPVLLNPNAGYNLYTDGDTEFRWSWEGTLAPDEYFQVQLIGPGGEHRGIHAPTKEYFAHADRLLYRLFTDWYNARIFATSHWTVAIVKWDGKDPSKIGPTLVEGEQRVITL